MHVRVNGDSELEVGNHASVKGCLSLCQPCDRLMSCPKKMISSLLRNRGTPNRKTRRQDVAIDTVLSSSSFNDMKRRKRLPKETAHCYLTMTSPLTEERRMQMCTGVFRVLTSSPARHNFTDVISSFSATTSLDITVRALQGQVMEYPDRSADLSLNKPEAEAKVGKSVTRNDEGCLLMFMEQYLDKIYKNI